MKKYILIIVLGLSILSFGACNSKSTPSDHKSKTEPATQSAPEHHQDEHAMLGVQGLCEMCKERIETAAKGVEGVSSAMWNIEKKELHLNFNPHQTNLDAISKAIAKAGHDTDKDKADQAAYDALPSCCKYRQ
jgi:mercuric ion binding protein